MLPGGATKVSKWYTLGRTSKELAYVSGGSCMLRACVCEWEQLHDVCVCSLRQQWSGVGRPGPAVVGGAS